MIKLRPREVNDLHKFTQLISTNLGLSELTRGQSHVQGGPILKLYVNLGYLAQKNKFKNMCNKWKFK